ncbi:hypothetical protein [Tindallia californiensis]|uniref:Uncharacterized protein n=1 Tax=Tindallia californiensis TaxID=159292 RepID=A0A1H3NVQ7_9FIRM|nr:hypothetical protein [Tindallia californiensis]SDY92982.1 hypothetical protein SAMN05192546_105319 [Tindallia californiensis]
MTLQFISKEEFIKHAAFNCIGQLSESDKESIRNNPDPTELHFGLGNFVRNEYIYDNKQIQFKYSSEDDLSSKIIQTVISTLIKE